MPRTVKLEDHRPRFPAGLGDAAGRDVPAVSGRPDLIDGTAIGTRRVRAGPGELARRAQLLDQGARLPAERRARAAGSAVDGPAADDVPAARRLLHRDTVGVVARRALRAGAANLLLPLRGAGRAQFDQPVHAQALGRLGLRQCDGATIRRCLHVPGIHVDLGFADDGRERFDERPGGGRCLGRGRGSRSGRSREPEQARAHAGEKYRSHSRLAALHNLCSRVRTGRAEHFEHLICIRSHPGRGVVRIGKPRPGSSDRKPTGPVTTEQSPKVPGEQKTHPWAISALTEMQQISAQNSGYLCTRPPT